MFFPFRLVKNRKSGIPAKVTSIFGQQFRPLYYVLRKYRAVCCLFCKIGEKYMSARFFSLTDFSNYKHQRFYGAYPAYCQGFSSPFKIAIDLHFLI